jgi:hypothetical protein
MATCREREKGGGPVAQGMTQEQVGGGGDTAQRQRRCGARHRAVWGKDRGGEALMSGPEVTVVGLNPVNQVKNRSNKIEFKI